MPFRIKFFSISNKVKIILVFWGEIWGEYGIKKRNPLINRGLQVLKVVPQGLEPQPAEPKSDVLPLHHGTILKLLREKQVQKYNKSFNVPNISTSIYQKSSYYSLFLNCCHK